MNRKTLTILILAIMVLVIGLIIVDFTGDKPDKRGSNPYEFNIDEYKKVDESLVHYRETKNINLGESEAGAIAYYGGLLYVAGKDFINVITPEGILKESLPLEGKAECLAADQEILVLGFSHSAIIMDHQLNKFVEIEIPEEKTVVTSVAISEKYIFIADAGNRRVLRYDRSGTLLGQFEGKRESVAGHGFIVPSANFDLVVDPYDELWVVNPGEHAVENYSDEGQIRGYWTKRSAEIDGFTGCCNPAELAVMSDGSFITGEKGLVRIKIYKPSGELRSVVAPPDKFEEEGLAPEPVADEQGVIYALDFNRNAIRIFEPKKQDAER